MAAGTAFAQSSSPSPGAQPGKPPEEYRLSVSVNLVNVPVTVSDARGNFVSGLNRENFRVYDDGVEQPVTHFASVEAPAQVLFLVETSPAVYLIHGQHLEAAYALLEGLGADDRVALATYDQSAQLVVDFTADKAAVSEALDGLHYNLGTAGLRLFDSLGPVLDWFAHFTGKKAVVILGTGLDESGGSSWDALQKKLQTSEVMLLPVALGGALREPEKKKKSRITEQPHDADLSFESADRTLEMLAQMTGGRAYFPHDARDLDSIYRQIATLLRHHYSLGFQPRPPNPGVPARYHKIEVQLSEADGRPSDPSPSGRRLTVTKTGHRVHARPGYLAPQGE